VQLSFISYFLKKWTIWTLLRYIRCTIP